MKPLNKNQKILVAAAALLLSSGIAEAQDTTTVFYTVGHQDDWQLFMNPNAFYDVRVAQAKTVFIYLTAGDAGLGTGRQGRRREPYFRARERAAERATQFIATPPSWYPSDTVVRREDVNGHSLLKKTYGLSSDTVTTNTVSYFFQLPDGFPDGMGPRDEDGNPIGGPSLMQLQQGDISSITDILGYQTYEGWDDLVLTLRRIVEIEAAGSTTVWANMPDPRGKPGAGAEPSEDHADHLWSGLAMWQAVDYYSCVNKALFLGYQTTRMPANLSEQQLIWEAATFGATVAGRMERGGAYNTFNGTHIGYLGRNYFSRFVGDGRPCSF